jgi:hypothetical protein
MRIGVAVILALSAVTVEAHADGMNLISMDGRCRPNSQLSPTTRKDVEAKTTKTRRYNCNKAVISEFDNGRVVINVTNTTDPQATLVGYSGVYANKGGDKDGYMEVDGMYFVDPKSDGSGAKKDNASGYCELHYKKRQLSNVSCISVTTYGHEDVILASAVFDVTRVSQERISGPRPGAAATAPAPAQPAPSTARPPWYGVSSDGSRCEALAMSPADKIEWLRERGLKYDTHDYSGPSVNGRPPKVTIIPRDGRYASSVYYATKEFCEEKEVNISKYR